VSWVSPPFVRCVDAIIPVRRIRRCEVVDMFTHVRMNALVVIVVVVVVVVVVVLSRRHRVRHSVVQPSSSSSFVALVAGS